MSDNGKLNDRIIAREGKQDYLARVEAPRKRVPVLLASPEAKRLFARFFDSMQLHTNFISNIARSRLSSDDIEQVEALIAHNISQSLIDMDKALADAEALCKANHISEFAEYAQDPLDEHVGVISSLSRQYLDLIVRFDQVMPMLATLEIDGLVRKRELDARIAQCKKLVKRIAYSTRELANGVRRRMNQMAEDVALPKEAAGTNIEMPRPIKKQLFPNGDSMTLKVNDQFEPKDKDDLSKGSTPDSMSVVLTSPN
ncbi:DUF1845 domain-containing protein [Actimicrobium sp. CCI2.3]|uniref:DUF1845 domain-containing protein n=1 Tax=Actimicrobium sp. CCI2.3 TaxID=3048616 RepID=UPI002AB4FCD3|nr:DUF1845 domain-containing protein [Actimicrobium sp. CCI2.3]MDY7574384.1 DUF1845 domain-containing protein [Actimicrobium sp. CCI2.3]MEB0022537.1 DUF1845 domain-containing protein [Actimicrobium sp. CCI2.3]